MVVNDNVYYEGTIWLRRLAEIMLSPPRAFLSHQCKALAGNGSVLAKKRNAAVMAQGRPNGNIIFASLLSDHGYSHLTLVDINQKGNGCLSWYYVTDGRTKPYPSDNELAELEVHLKRISRKQK